MHLFLATRWYLTNWRELKTWIRSNSSVKGRPNLTVVTFRSRMVSVPLPQVRLHHPQVRLHHPDGTAVRWLHQLGFEPASAKKGDFIDGHECSGVVDYRKLYLRKLETLVTTHAPPPPVSDELATSEGQRHESPLFLALSRPFFKCCLAQPLKFPSRPRLCHSAPTKVEVANAFGSLLKYYLTNGKNSASY